MSAVSWARRLLVSHAMRGQVANEGVRQRLAVIPGVFFRFGLTRGKLIAVAIDAPPSIAGLPSSASRTSAAIPSSFSAASCSRSAESSKKPPRSSVNRSRMMLPITETDPSVEQIEKDADQLFNPSIQNLEIGVLKFVQ